MTHFSAFVAGKSAVLIASPWLFVVIVLFPAIFEIVDVGLAPVALHQGALTTM